MPDWPNIIRAFGEIGYIGYLISATIFFVFLFLLFGRFSKVGTKTTTFVVKSFIGTLLFLIVVYSLSGLISDLILVQYKEDKILSFRLLNIQDSMLTQKIESYSGLVSSKSVDAKYTISFSHSGDLEDGAVQGLFYYNGGYLEILVNGTVCEQLPMLKVKPFSDHPGNKKKVLLKALNEVTTKLVKDNLEIISNSVSDCIRLSGE